MARSQAQFPLPDPHHKLQGEPLAEVIDELKRALKDQQAAVRAGAVAWLQEYLKCFRDDSSSNFIRLRTFNAVESATGDEDPVVRAKAVAAWPLFVPPSEAIETLIGATTDPDPGVREVALRSLPHIDWRETPSAVSALLRAIDDQSPAVRTAAIEALQKTGLWEAPSVFSALLRAIEDQNPAVRTAAIGALQKTTLDAASAAVPALIKALKDLEVEVRSEAVSTLAWLREEAEDAVPALIDLLLHDPDEAMCEAAVRTALAIDPEHHVIEPLLLNAKDHQEKVLTILRKIGLPARPLRRKLQAPQGARPAGRSPVETSASTRGRRTGREKRKADGPEEPGLLWWKGLSYPVSKIPHLLLSYMWNKDKAKLEDVEEAVWGSEVTDNQIKSALHDLKVVLDLKQAKSPAFGG